MLRRWLAAFIALLSIILAGCSRTHDPSPAVPATPVVLASAREPEVAPTETPPDDPPVIDRVDWVARVDVSAAHGGLEVSDAFTSVSAAKNGVSSKCHRKVSESRKLSVGLTVETNGKVSSAAPLDGEDDDPLIGCVLTELRQLSFPTRARSSNVVVAVDWVPAGTAGRQRGMEEVMTVVNANKAAIRKDCVSHVPIAGSRVLLHFVIATDGSVATIKADTDNTPLGECVTMRVMNWPFPPADEPTTVDLPFVFRK